MSSSSEAAQHDYITVREFKHYTDQVARQVEKNAKDLAESTLQWRVDFEKRISSLEAKQWIQIGILGFQLIISVVILTKVLL